MDIAKLFTKRNIIIFLAITTTAILAIWAFYPKNTLVQDISYTKMSLQYPLATDTRASDGSIVFNNGRSFIAYNPDSGEVSQLTPETTLPTIGTMLMRPDSKGALFQTVSQTFNDNLAPALNERGIDLNQPYWWYIDFDSNSYTLITNPQNNQPVEFRQVAWIDNNSFVGSTSLETQTQISIFSDLKTLKTQYNINGSISSFAVNDGKIIYQSNITISQSNLYTNNPTQILDNVSTAVISPTGSWAFIYEPVSSEKVNTYIYNFDSKKKILQSQSQEAYASWAKDDQTIFVTYQGGSSEITMKSINVETQKETLYKSTELKIGMLSVPYAQNANLFIATDFDSIYLASDSSSASKFKIPDNFKTITQGDTTIEYYPNQGYFIATTFGPDTQETRKMIADQLKASGVTPELVQINYIWQELRSSGN
ncbi:MAG: hypothetical protein PVI21_02695 [Candidatus Woesebacteria bacterium]|jgi:hypothetical protein